MMSSRKEFEYAIRFVCGARVDSCDKLTLFEMMGFPRFAGIIDYGTAIDAMHTVRTWDAAIWQGSHPCHMPRAAEGRRCAYPGQAGAAGAHAPGRRGRSWGDSSAAALARLRSE